MQTLGTCRFIIKTFHLMLKVFSGLFWNLSVLMTPLARVYTMPTRGTSELMRNPSFLWVETHCLPPRPRDLQPEGWVRSFGIINSPSEQQGAHWGFSLAKQSKGGPGNIPAAAALLSGWSSGHGSLCFFLLCRREWVGEEDDPPGTMGEEVNYFQSTHFLTCISYKETVEQLLFQHPKGCKVPPKVFSCFWILMLLWFSVLAFKIQSN